MSYTLYAGYAKEKVTPPMGLNIPGYFSKRYSDGIITDLYLHATALSDGENKALFFSCDAIGMHAAAYHAIRDKIAERCNIDPSSIYIHCTHSHTAFRITKPGKENDANDIYMARLFQQFADCAQFAFEDLKPVTAVKTAKGEVKGVGFIRRYRMKDGSCKTNPGIGNPDIVDFDGVQDESLQIVRLIREDAKEILLVNFGTHPDVIGGTKYCADWPGYVMENLIGAFDGNIEVLYLNGCQGDSNHHNCFLPKGSPRKGVPLAQRMARKISGEVLKIYDNAQDVPYQKIAFSNKIVKVGKNPYDPADVPEAKEIHKLYRELQTSSDPVFKQFKLNVPEALRIVRNLSNPEFFELQISSIQLGNIAFIGLQGEPFVEIGRQIKEKSKMDMTICTCVTNGGQGYFPTASAFAEKGYERSTSPFAHNVAELLIDGALDLINDMEVLAPEATDAD